MQIQDIYIENIIIIKICKYRGLSLNVYCDI